MRPLLALACSSLLVLAGQAVGQACNAGIEYFELEGFITAATISDGALGGPIALFSANEVRHRPRPLPAQACVPECIHAPCRCSAVSELCLELPMQRRPVAVPVLAVLEMMQL